MSLPIVVLILSTLAGVAAVALLATPGHDSMPGAGARPREIQPGGRCGSGVGVAAGAVVFAFSGWVVPALVVGVGDLGGDRVVAATRPTGRQRGRAHRRPRLVDREPA